VEFSYEKGGVESRADKQKNLEIIGKLAPYFLAESQAAQESIWELRKVGLGILLSRPGDEKPWSFIEDLAVPVERLGEFVREADYIFSQYGTTAEMYAHASAGCLHIRPILSLKSRQGVKNLREIASKVVSLTLNLGGSVSGEHGDGISRSEWLPHMYGEEITEAFRILKRAADPRELLNPGKIVCVDNNQNVRRMDENLRFGDKYGSSGAWDSFLSFQGEGGLDGAIEQCNGAGVCRKDGGTMCPSFQVTRDEMHSTRGRANLLRALISGKFPSDLMAEEIVYQALDLCLACKGCKSECPSAVDMAKLKYEFLNHYYSDVKFDHHRRLRDYIFGYIDRVACIARPLAPLANLISQSIMTKKIGEWLFGFSQKRSIPRIKNKKFAIARLGGTQIKGDDHDPVILLLDAFTEYFYPELGYATLDVLRRAGCTVYIPRVIGAGRTLLSKGFLDAVKRHAKRVVDQLYMIDPEGRVPFVGIEPSEIYTLRDEYLDLLPDDPRIVGLKERVFTIEEFLVRPAMGEEGDSDRLRIDKVRIAIHSKAYNQSSLVNTPVISKPKNILLHIHCYQKTQPPSIDGHPNGGEAIVKMLASCGYDVRVVDAGCCGMAGAFGYESEHYQLSMQVGELALFPAIREVNDKDNVIVAASGASCRPQIKDGTGQVAVHPITLI
jgi:Fe-S oxidoreductase